MIGDVDVMKLENRELSEKVSGEPLGYEAMKTKIYFS